MSWKKAVVVLIGLSIFMFWMYVPEEDFEDDDKYSVTFTYDCREVMEDEDVPEHVLEECKIIMKETKNDRPTI